MATMATINHNKNADWQNKYKTTQSKLAFLFENELLSDVKFIVGEFEKAPVFAHKFVLMMGSPFFENMFNNGNSHSSTRSEIRVPDCTPIIFKAMLKFIYMDRFEFDIGDTDHVMNLLVASSKYGLTNLTAQCSSVLIASISEKNAINVYQLAIIVQQKDLSDYALEYICRKGKAVLSGAGDLCILAKENLKRLARSDALNIDEMDLFKAVVKWGLASCQFHKKEATKENLREILKDIIPHIRFFLMTAEDISLHVVTLNILTDEELVQIYRHCTVSNNFRGSITSSIFNPKPRKRFWIVERFTSTANRTCWKNKARGWLCKPKWQYISFKVDHPINVVGIGLYGESSVSVGEYFGTCKPYSYEVRMYNDSSQMLQSTGSQSIANPGKIVHVQFDTPVPIIPQKYYTIVSRIRSNTASFVGEGGRSQIKMSCGKTFVHFSFKDTANLQLEDCIMEENSPEDQTNVRRGEIPEIAFSLAPKPKTT